jgi:hypothetical protein
MNAYAETEPIMDYNQDETQDNAMPVWLWMMSMILMPAATGLMTGMLENGWLPETFRIMLSNVEEAEKDDKTD